MIRVTKREALSHCPNHSDRLPECLCAVCHAGFCSSCVVELLGQPHCGPCRDARVVRMQTRKARPVFRWLYNIFLAVTCTPLAVGMAFAMVWMPVHLGYRLFYLIAAISLGGAAWGAWRDLLKRR